LGEQSGWNGFRFNRRDFIRYSLATSVAVWAGSNIPAGLGIDRAEAQDLFSVEQSSQDVVASAFPQSIASGDPQPRGIVLWSRINPRTIVNRRRRRRRKNLDRRRRRIRNRARLDLNVAYQIAEDQNFNNVVLSGVLTTSPERDYTVKTQLSDRTELNPFTTYYYRFIYGGVASRTGRFKTLPDPNDNNLSKVRFGYISCQDYTNGYYNALRYLADEDVDFVVHLGDYIYETVDDSNFQNGQVRTITLPNEGDPKEADTLNDYRFLYKTYKADENLQKVHENFAFINIWDDHEFANDCYQTVAPDAETGANSVPQRREAANRAWAEYSPVGETGPTEEQVHYDPAKGPLDEITIYRAFAFGNLMELVMTDERLYRDGPPNGNQIQDRYLTPGNPEPGEGEESPSRTILGKSPNGTVPSGSPNASQQKDFFVERMLGSQRKWKIWGNEVSLLPNNKKAA
jgi:alkaline phosphatase D